MKRSLFFVLLLCWSAGMSAQMISIKWRGFKELMSYDSLKLRVFDFEDAVYELDNNFLPFFHYQKNISTNNVEVSFLEGIISSIDKDEVKGISGLESIKSQFQFDYYISRDRKEYVLNLRVVPVRYNSDINEYERLETFYYFISEGEEIILDKKVKDITDSKLKTGKWYKFFIAEDGFYKITYEDLKSLGIDVDNIDPRKIQIFGNGGGMLKELAGAERYKDLHEIPIIVEGESDGKFNTTDNIVLFAQGPDKWEYKNNMFMYERNLYTRKAGYFLTYNQENGKRIQNREEIGEAASVTIDNFIDYKYKESALFNPIKSGKRWYGETFDINTHQIFNFNFANINKDRNAVVYYEIAARQFSLSSFTVDIESYHKTFTFRPVSTSLGSEYALTGKDFATFKPVNNTIAVDMTFNKPASNANAWLRCIYVNACCYLNFSGGTLFFRSRTADLPANKVAQYKLTANNTNNLLILDITKPAEPQKVDFTKQQNYITFPFKTDLVYQYVCFDGSGYKSVEFQKESLENQNIHGMDSPDMVIVYKDILYEQALRLYNYHNSKGLKTYLIDVDKIYNEFSSGVPDVCAIRDMMKMWYDTDKEPKYLLLIGSASFDPLNRINPNKNDILIYQTEQSMHQGSSVCSDDFYGFMDDNEGLFSTGDAIDIAVGRLPVHTASEAKDVIDKILAYTNNGQEQFGNWRNIVTLVADDADGGELNHLEWSEYYAKILENNHKEFNVNKIYAGTYTQISTAGGQRYPETTNDINARIDQGTLLFMYSGHGGIRQLAHEQLVSISDINSWKNFNKLTFFATGTCSFAVYDDPTFVSAGELVLLNKRGGAVGMLSTTRVTGGGNEALFKQFFSRVFAKDQNNKYKNIGDIIRETKNGSSAVSTNNMAYALLGDPAIPLNYPSYNKSVRITSLKVDGIESDTIRAFSKVDIEGNICDEYQTTISDFNGFLYPEVHDKPLLVNTLGNDNAPVQSFYSDNSLIYKGKVSIKNGKFSFSFIAPKDISYVYGKAKMSFYFEDELKDGNGFFTDYIVGGSVAPSFVDDVGPEINLYINDSSFVNGDVVNENPIIYANIYDFSGINTTGNGIGHDLIAYIDDNMNVAYNINSYYESELDSYQKGKVTYPMFNLSSGLHSVSIRVWDVFNNSSVSKIDFIVVSSDTISISSLFNYPNPFYDHTKFSVKHNQTGSIIDAKLFVFDLNGNLIKTIATTLSPHYLNEAFFTWDGRADNGRFVSDGIYVYKLVLTKENGESAHKSGKLIKQNFR